MNRIIKTFSTPFKIEDNHITPCAVCGGSRFKHYFSCGDFFYVRCLDCGLVQINPQPKNNLVLQRYDSSYLDYEIKNKDKFADLAMLSLNDADLIEIEDKHKNDGDRNALDIGCATGAIAAKLRERGWNVSGIEICAEQADYARKQYGLDVSNLPLEENNFNAGSFSLVLASHLIEHLTNPAVFVEEVCRILKAGGNFIIITPNVSGFQAKLFKGRWRSAIFDHLYLFSVETLKQLLIQKGFCIEKIVTWGGIAAGAAPVPVKKIMDVCAKKFGFGDVMLIRCVKGHC